MNCEANDFLVRSIDQRQFEDRRIMDHLGRTSILFREGAAQDFVTPNNLVQYPFEDVDPASEAPARGGR